MKSIKPNVLSKIVENTELTDLIVKLGRGRKKIEGSEDLDIDERTVQRIKRELSLINMEEGEKEGGDWKFDQRQEENRETRPDDGHHAKIVNVLSEKTSGKEVVNANVSEEEVPAYN